MANLEDCNAVIWFLVCYCCYFALIAPWSSFCDWAREKAESLIKQTIKPFSADWFTNLDGKGERGATEMFLHHVADPLRGTEQISHFLGTQVTETLHRPQGTNKDIWGWQCQGSNTNLSAPEQSQPPACNLVLITLESPELFLSGDTARASETQG